MFHPLSSTIAPPVQLNNPFDYEPHPLALLAAAEVNAYIARHAEWADELQQGKMLGVLVCRTADGQLGFLAAYSGQLGGREDWPWFVPAVFDYLQPDGYFRREEAAISAINRQLAEQETSPEWLSRHEQAAAVRREVEAEEAATRRLMAASKERRDACRGRFDDEVLNRESQFQKAELRRLKQQWRERLAQAEAPVRRMATVAEQLKEERRRRSDALQRWLFDHFVMRNGHGRQRTLTDIFAATPQRLPPAGAGECCAPKLLQYAFCHRLQPLCIAEYWHGASPKAEVRHAGHFYPACRGKCKPILEWMLGLATPSGPVGGGAATLSVLHADAAVIVVNKPAGLLSVPGRTGEPSVESLLKQQYGEVHMVHRLDQDTSGLMVVARSPEARRALQRQFLAPEGADALRARDIYKMYVALLDGHVEGSGTISLPLRPDVDDRPRQLVDHEQGKAALTYYRVVGHEQGRTRVELTPHTGRTHQLRMHCAHCEGLAAPIVGDRLYGHATPKGQRLCLHAAVLAFLHPLTGERMSFSADVPF